MNVAMLLATFCGLMNFHSINATTASFVKGDYVEARSCSVFAGPCHFNGEVMTQGRDAIMAWNFQAGFAGDVDLAGVKAVAVVSADDNLDNASASRQSEITIDSSATDAQAAAAVQVLESHYGKVLGEVVAVRRVPITFKHEDRQYTVDATGFASMSVSGMPNDECCKQTNLVWYNPLIQLTGRKVGYTATASYTSGAVGESWQRSDENSAFYGAFAF